MMPDLMLGRLYYEVGLLERSAGGNGACRVAGSIHGTYKSLQDVATAITQHVVTRGDRRGYTVGPYQPTTAEENLQPLSPHELSDLCKKINEAIKSLR